ncbi:endopeptidase La [Mycoplasma sp. 1018B]|uniref:endopeptidase La n=1 Tax=Mycoplasma sp. 1018B TaxID=2967302 RepID=UPI00211C4E3F|nr:endopeptidase La [Mycoplasma sp. 1018B]
MVDFENFLYFDLESKWSNSWVFLNNDYRKIKVPWSSEWEFIFSEYNNFRRNNKDKKLKFIAVYYKKSENPDIDKINIDYSKYLVASPIIADKNDKFFNFVVNRNRKRKIIILKKFFSRGSYLYLDDITKNKNNTFNITLKCIGYIDFIHPYNEEDIYDENGDDPDNKINKIEDYNRIIVENDINEQNKKEILIAFLNSFKKFYDYFSVLFGTELYLKLIDHIIKKNKYGISSKKYINILRTYYSFYSFKNYDISISIKDMLNYNEKTIDFIINTWENIDKFIYKMISYYAIFACISNYERLIMINWPIIDQLEFLTYRLRDLVSISVNDNILNSKELKKIFIIYDTYDYLNFKEFAQKDESLIPDNYYDILLNHDDTKEEVKELKDEQEAKKLYLEMVNYYSLNKGAIFMKKLGDKETKEIDEQEKQLLDLQVEYEIAEKMKNNLDKQQKDFILREKLKAIKDTINENNPNSLDNNDEYYKNLNNPKAKYIYPESVKKLIEYETEKLKQSMQGTPDSNIIQSYISVLKSLPWRKVEIESLDINKVKKILEKNHYGLKEVKQRIIEYLALIINHKNNNLQENNSKLIDLEQETQIDLNLFKENQNNKIQKDFNNVPILTLVGPPGTGKTSLARAIAEALNKSYIKISLGGVRDESEIRGHRRTYVGAMPGKIIKAIQKAGVSNPLILLDEIDKMSSDYKGDPTSAMLEVLDPEQNTKFQDNYVEHEYDLSKVMFIATANYYENIPAPLLDRVEIIELSSYTISEKIKIVREHLIDIVIKQAGLKPNQFQIDDLTIEYIIKHYTMEAGVRGLKRQLDKIARKIVTKVVSGENIEDFIVDKKQIEEFLGVPKFTEQNVTNESEIGVVNGLAYTTYGGSTLQIEVTTFESDKGGIRLTGSLKDVMKESANIALTFVRSNASKFGINNFNFDKNEIHIHVPEGAVPKDGPSAGVTFTTALISALTNKKVSKNIAMTGEITLRGKILEIGGLKEKSFAAFTKGIKTVFIPYGNKKNIIDIPKEVAEKIKFIPVKTYDEIYERIFK